MPTTIQMKQGVNSIATRYTGEMGEGFYNQTVKTLHMLDGTTPGGTPLAKADVSNVMNPNFDNGSTHIQLPAVPSSSRPTNTAFGMIYANESDGTIEFARDALGNAETWIPFLAGASISESTTTVNVVSPIGLQLISGVAAFRHRTGSVRIGAVRVQFGTVFNLHFLSNGTSAARGSIPYPTAFPTQVISLIGTPLNLRYGVLSLDSIPSSSSTRQANIASNRTHIPFKFSATRTNDSGRLDGDAAFSWIAIGH